MSPPWVFLSNVGARLHLNSAFHYLTLSSAFRKVATAHKKRESVTHLLAFELSQYVADSVNISSSEAVCR